MTNLLFTAHPWLHLGPSFKPTPMRNVTTNERCELPGRISQGRPLQYAAFSPFVFRWPARKDPIKLDSRRLHCRVVENEKSPLLESDTDEKFCSLSSLGLPSHWLPGAPSSKLRALNRPANCPYPPWKKRLNWSKVYLVRKTAIIAESHEYSVCASISASQFAAHKRSFVTMFVLIP